MSEAIELKEVNNTGDVIQLSSEKKWFLGNDKLEWAQILGCLFSLYLFVGLFFGITMYVTFKFGQPVLWTYLVVFVLFILSVAASVYVGQEDMKRSLEPEE